MKIPPIFILIFMSLFVQCQSKKEKMDVEKEIFIAIDFSDNEEYFESYPKKVDK